MSLFAAVVIPLFLPERSFHRISLFLALLEEVSDINSKALGSSLLTSVKSRASTAARSFSTSPLPPSFSTSSSTAKQANNPPKPANQTTPSTKTTKTNTQPSSTTATAAQSSTQTILPMNAISRKRTTTCSGSSRLKHCVRARRKRGSCTAESWG